MATVTKRRDAVANQARILDAALELFVERGLDVPIPDIAARAGVGKATVYRNYPTKADLVAAISLERMGIARSAVERALEFDDPWEGFGWYVEEVLVLQAHDRALGDAMRHEMRPDIAK